MSHISLFINSINRSRTGLARLTGVVAGCSTLLRLPTWKLLLKQSG